jgi:hypothetical protein
VRGAIRVSKLRPASYADNPGFRYPPRENAEHATDHAFHFLVGCRDPLLTGAVDESDGELHAFHCAMRLVLAIESSLLGDVLAEFTAEVPQCQQLKS